MKYYLSLIILLVVACHSSKKSFENKSTPFNGYKVYKIDSIRDVYIIYARDNNKVPYKIVSHKENTFNGELIKLNNAYPFFLETLWSKKFDLVNGTYYYDVPIFIEGDSILSLHTARNIRGLRIR